MHNDGGPRELRTNSVRRTLKTANEGLHRSSCTKNPVIRYGYNEYMVHHFAYMRKVVEIRKLESYAKEAYDT